MGWTAPRTWTSGEVITADGVGGLNEQIRDNFLYLHSLCDPNVYSVYPLPVTPVVGVNSQSLNAVTVAHLGVVFVPKPIVLEAIQYNISAAGGGATSAIRFALYSEDGQTKYFDGPVDVCGAATGVRTITLASPVTLLKGNYILFHCQAVYDTSNKWTSRPTCDGTFCVHYAGEPDLSGQLTIVGGAAPATIDVDAYTVVTWNTIPLVRFRGVCP